MHTGFAMKVFAVIIGEFYFECYVALACSFNVQTEVLLLWSRNVEQISRVN